VTGDYTAGDQYTVHGDAVGSAFGPGSQVHNRHIRDRAGAPVLEAITNLLKLLPVG